MLRHGTGTPIEVPTHCPVCGSLLEEAGSEEGVALMCRNPNCGDRVVRRIVYFASRPCMDILGLGSAAVRKLVEAGLCTSPADLYSLRQEQVQALDSFGRAKTMALLREIERSKQQPAVRVLTALGLPEIGPRVAEVLLSEWGSIPKLVAYLGLDSGPLLNKLMELPHIGPTKALIVKRGLTNEDTLELVHRLEEAGLQMVCDTRPAAGALMGEVICITGKLSKPRAVLAEWIKSHGGSVSDMVTHSTTMLLAGDSGERESTKVKKAKKLHVRIITEDELKEVVND